MRLTRYAVPALAAALLAGCSQEGGAPPEQAARPPSKVGVVVAAPRALPLVSELPGRIAPTRIAEVRPRVGGIVLKRVFEQGSEVTEGQPLFEIDPAPLAVQAEASRAAVARAEAVAEQARQEEARTRRLVSTRTSSEATLETAVAARKQADADLASASASLKSAELSLSYATVRSPIAGRVGAALVTEGALVSANDTAALATVQRLDPVYADFRQPASEFTRLREALRNGSLEAVAPEAAKARILMDDGSEYPHAGRLLFAEATVDPQSGQVSLRAEFPNPDGNLLPGMYVRVLVEEGIDAKAIAVPTQAIQRDGNGSPQLYLVGDDGKAAIRPVKATRVVGNDTVVDEGLKEGERVVVDGVQKIGPGAPVDATPWEGPANAPKTDEAATPAAAR